MQKEARSFKLLTSKYTAHRESLQTYSSFPVFMLRIWAVE